MTFNLTEHKGNFLFLPLGGSGEIGMNLNLYHYKGKWLMVDCGAGFAEDYLPGASLIVPDISFIVKHQKDLLGIVITHIHEDHIGGVQYLWESLRCPIYTTPIATSFLKARLADLGKQKNLMNQIKIHEMPEKSNFQIGPFELAMVPLCHSTPEMQALVIKTDLGSVFHTGDWKFDSNPLIGEINDENLLNDYGNKGVLALIGDSTNVFNSEFSGSEGELRQSLISLINQCNKMVLVTTFASNVARLETLIIAAHQAGRFVVLAGRSVKRIIIVAKECGYLKNVAAFVDEKDACKYPREKLMIISTGCQGEPLAALTKMSKNIHPRLRLIPGDTVIFSSKIIPGNDKKIYRVFNNLVKLGIDVMTERDHFVHVSGHPSKKELEKLYKLIRPKIAIPVHGELTHMHEHAKLAKSVGVETVFEVENGDIIKLAPNKPTKVCKVQAGELAIDGNCLLSPSSSVMKMRRKIQLDGIVIVTLFISQNFILKTDPVISAPGCLDEADNKHLIIHIQDEIISMFSNSSPIGKMGIIVESYKKQTKSLVKSILKLEIGKFPEIEVNIRIV
jgi:ribonuclease J